MQKFGYGIWKTKCTVMDAANTIRNIDVKLAVLCGSVAIWIRIALHGSTLIWLSWIRIRIGNADPDPDQVHGN